MLKKPKPEISVIVCHHKGDFIYKFVESVKKSVDVSYEIIVMSSDENVYGNGIPGCIVFNGPPMPAEKRNMGARIARGNYLAFFDDDVEISPTCLLELYTNCGFSMVYGKLHKADERNRFDEAGGYLTSTGFLWSRAGQNDLDEGQFDTQETILAGKSASCMIHRTLFKKVGGFDEDFEILGEETDLSWRVWLNGGKVYFVPSATGIHYFNTKFKPVSKYYTNERVYFNGCRNYITMLIKNLEWRNLSWILPQHILIWVIAGFLMLLRGRLKSGLNIFRGLWYIVRNLGMILEKRRKVQSSRAKSDGECWTHIYRRPPKGYYIQRFTKYITGSLHG